MSNATLPQPKNTLYLIDISSFIFRAFFAIRSLHNRTGEPTNAVYGVATMLVRLAEEAKPEYLAVVYDSKEPSFRKEIYPEYKSNRSAPPEDLIPQFARIESLIRTFEIHSYRQAGFEADDLIATLTRRWIEEASDHSVVIVSSDKDLMQLVSDRVCLWDTMSNKIYGPAAVQEKFGVRPDQIRDYLALVGDSSDNIPGVTGIGPKGATDLLKEHQTLEGILSAAQEGKIAGKKGETLKAQQKEAKLSAELATVLDQLDVEIPFEALKYHFHITPECIALMQELDFHSLLVKWEAKGKKEGESSLPAQEVRKPLPQEEEVPALPTVSETPAAVDTASLVKDDRFRMINTQKDFEKLLHELEKSKRFGFDLETTSLNPRQAEIVGIAIGYHPDFAFYIPVGHQGEGVHQLARDSVLNQLKPYLEDPKFGKIGQNLKYDWSVLRSHGWNPSGIEADTMVAGYVLDPNGRHNLKTLAAHYLNYTVLTYEEVCGKGKNETCFDQIPLDLATRYSAEDAWVAMQLWIQQEPLIRSEGLTEIFEKIDLPLVNVLAKMELEGVCIDVPWLKKLSNDFGFELKGIEERIQAFTGAPVNLNSPKQIAQLLFEQLKLPTQSKTKTGFSTDASVLEILAPLHEVPRLLLEYREISKLKGTYIDPLPELRDPKTGRIHTSFHQTVAATGRLSCSDPNLQNIPIRSERGTMIRRAFIPSEGNVLLSADYNQVELRLLAHMSGDPELTSAFQKDQDVHRRTAGEIFGISPEAVDDRQRSIAKAINFGLMYGKTAFGLAQELKIPRKEAQQMITRYFDRYHSVKTFLDSQIKFAQENGYVQSMMGRKRRLPDIHSKNAAIRSNAERMAMNSPIQGTAADLMKLAMIEVDRKLETGGFTSKLIIQVHDEVVLDCSKKEVDEVTRLVVAAMEGVCQLSVPLKVSVGTGKNWEVL